MTKISSNLVNLVNINNTAKVCNQNIGSQTDTTETNTAKKTDETKVPKQKINASALDVLSEQNKVLLNLGSTPKSEARYTDRGRLKDAAINGELKPGDQFYDKVVRRVYEDGNRVYVEFDDFSTDGFRKNVR